VRLASPALSLTYQVIAGSPDATYGVLEPGSRIEERGPMMDLRASPDATYGVLEGGLRIDQGVRIVDRPKMD
jgi:hypothetical protein